LNHLERFHRVFQFKEVDRVPDYEFGYWDETIDRWHREGLPLEVKTNRDVELYLKLEGWDCIDMLPVVTGLWPPLPSRIIKEERDRMLVYDGMGGIYLATKSTSSPPHYIKYPLRTREDWEKLKPFFDPNTPGRFPLNWDEVVAAYREREAPLGIFVGSLYGWLRNLMGVQGISIAFYRDPDWVAEMMDTLVNLWISVIHRALRSIRVDFATWWEDMCYNRGPLISVRHFEEFMVPRYKKVTDVLKEYGVTINIVDCDGDITRLVPGWLKGGINCMFPLEARCTDVYKLREQYGHKVLLMGGVDKMALIAGGKAIDKELERLTPLLKDGGYIPMVDHRCPPEVSYQTYLYYLKKKREWIGRYDV
jgi:uroporphyrinogen decarboxylase